jgi:His Kinase A (phospho-acceptor) domain
MSAELRHKIYLGLSLAILAVHVAVAATAKGPSYSLTMYGDSLPCALLIIAVLAMRENFRNQSGVQSLFWKLVAAGLFLMLLSQCYWFFYDTMRRVSTPSPVPGDSLYLLGHVVFLSALALRPHSTSAGSQLRIRLLDFVLLTLWWFTLYGYFSLPWQWVIRDFTKYNPAYYMLALILHLVLICALALLTLRNRGVWRAQYAYFLTAFCLIAIGDLLQSVAINSGTYYAGSFYDTPFLFSIVWFTLIASRGAYLQPRDDATANRELRQSVWTARTAMLAILSLPVIALAGLLEKSVPAEVTSFRLRLVFGAAFVLGALAFWKLNVLAQELAHLVNLTHTSVEDLTLVQSRVAQSQKLTALGRLAAGAAHEISNPLTAILGYSELLVDLPSLTSEDKENAEGIQRQVHRAQAAVNSLRDSLRRPGPPRPMVAEKSGKQR